MRNLLLIAALLATACGHGSPRAASGVHDAAGCLAACPGASVVETSQDGAMCRCWQHRAGLQYTFKYPETEQFLEYSRARWEQNIGMATGCKLQGLGWEATEDGKEIQCVTPDSQLDKALSKEPLKWTLVDEKHSRVGSP